MLVLLLLVLSIAHGNELNIYHEKIIKSQLAGNHFYGYYINSAFAEKSYKLELNSTDTEYSIKFGNIYNTIISSNGLFFLNNVTENYGLSVDEQQLRHIQLGETRSSYYYIDINVYSFHNGTMVFGVNNYFNMVDNTLSDFPLLVQRKPFNLNEGWNKINFVGSFIQNLSPNYFETIHVKTSCRAFVTINAVSMYAHVNYI